MKRIKSFGQLNESGTSGVVNMLITNIVDEVLQQCNGLKLEWLSGDTIKSIAGELSDNYSKEDDLFTEDEIAVYNEQRDHIVGKVIVELEKFKKIK